MSEKMPITPAVLVWARERSGRGLSDVQKKFAKIEDWESGIDQPSYPQLEGLSSLYKIPLAVFFMPDPPSEAPLKQKFRTIPEYELAHLPVILRKILREAQAMQLNLAELYGGINSSAKKIFSDLQFEVHTPIVTIAQKVRNYLSISMDEQAGWVDEKTAFEKWRDALISHGIYVFKDAFKDDGFSGFCLYDDQFPIIYVNNSTTPTRQNFTLFHELAHILFHTSGIDKKNDDYIKDLAGRERQIEVICNQFAGAFLVPDSDFDLHIRNIEFSDANLAIIANRYKVSRAVIFLKLLNRKIITQAFYEEKIEEWNNQINQERKGSGGNFYNTEIAYLGRRYINLAMSKYHQNKISNLQLADYLNIKPKHVGRFEEAFLGGRL